MLGVSFEMTEMTGRIMLKMEANEYNKLQRSRKVAFMMAWHSSMLRKMSGK